MTVAQMINARMEGLLMAYLQERMIGVAEKCCRSFGAPSSLKPTVRVALPWHRRTLAVAHRIMVLGISRMIDGKAIRIATLMMSTKTNQPQPLKMSPMETCGATPFRT